MAQSTSADSAALGLAGESFAANYYTQCGYEVIEKRARLSAGEIDLITRASNGTIAFVEVKTRRSRNFGAAEAVTPKKLHTMRRCAVEWLRGKPYSPVRFDVAEVIATGDKMTIRIFEDVDDGSC